MAVAVKVALAVAPDKPFEMREVELLPPRADEIRVRIAGSGICHTDVAAKMQQFAVPLPMVLGHEGAGVIEEVGSAVTHMEVGDHVVLTGDSCGRCASCHKGIMSYCDEYADRNLTGLRSDGSSSLRDGGGELRGRFVAQSSFATQVIASACGAVKIDKDLPIEMMGPLGCGIATGVGTVMNALRPEPGAKIAIFGAGTVGLAAVMGAVLVGAAEILVIDVNPARLELALSLGATYCIDPGEDAVVEQIVGITRGGADYSLECTGRPEVVRQAVECLDTPGWCAQVGVTPPGATVPLDMDQVIFGRGIRGVVMGEARLPRFIPYLADLYRTGRLPFDRFTRFYDFDDINQAVHDSAVTGAVVKPILRMA